MMQRVARRNPCSDLSDDRLEILREIAKMQIGHGLDYDSKIMDRARNKSTERFRKSQERKEEAESLLEELGYVNSDIERLVYSKRGLWRAARCMIDAGLPLGLLELEEAVALLVTVGFTEKEANAQINRFRLNPGYQLCYSYGRYEILKIRDRYSSVMGRDLFHRVLLEGGELPFHLVEKRFCQLTEKSK